MVRKRSIKAAAEQGDGAQLRHVLVVGGTLAEWDRLGADLWSVRRCELAKAVAHAGATWLTIRPYESGDEPRDPSRFVTARIIDVREGCTVVVDPAADGRARLLWAVGQLQEAHVAVIDELAVTSVLMAPAPVEPDLTIVLGSVTRLPPSLVWELAYSEIVFIDTRWDELTAAHVERATDEFSKRHRRFGGIE